MARLLLRVPGIQVPAAGGAAEGASPRVVWRAARRQAVANCKVLRHPAVAPIDSNPSGVKPAMRQTLSRALDRIEALPPWPHPCRRSSLGRSHANAWVRGQPGGGKNVPLKMPGSYEDFAQLDILVTAGPDLPIPPNARTMVEDPRDQARDPRRREIPQVREGAPQRIAAAFPGGG